MKKCKICGNEYDNNMVYCANCGQELVLNDLNEDSQNIDEPSKNSNGMFCIYCGGPIVEEKMYCSKCGRSAIDGTARHCILCGTPLANEQKFCAKCGHKVSNIIVPRSVENTLEKAKKINLKKVIILAIIIGFCLLLIILGKTYIPKLFISTEEYLTQGNYVKAYEKAKKGDKEAVLFENLIAYICAEAKTNLKDEDSFKLREIWYDEESDIIVLRIQGANSYGGDVTGYWYYSFDEEEKEYQLWDSVSDLEEEETYSWDDTEEKVEKILDNITKEIIKDVIGDKSNKIDSSVVKRINGLNKQELLDEVKLMDDVSKIYPQEEDDV